MRTLIRRSVSGPSRPASAAASSTISHALWPCDVGVKPVAWFTISCKEQPSTSFHISVEVVELPFRLIGPKSCTPTGSCIQQKHNRTVMQAVLYNVFL